MEIFNLVLAPVLLIPLILTSLVYAFIAGVSLYVSRRDAGTHKNRDHAPLISVVIPTFNEERIIAKKLENTLNTSYPVDKIEIIVVDSSTDSTPQVVKEFARRYPFMKLIHDDGRVGLAAALNKAYGACTGEIIVKSDSDILMERDTLAEMISNFADPLVGGVTGRLKVVNDVINEKNYRSIQQVIQAAESQIDSIYMAHPLAAYRRSLIRVYDPTEYGDETIQTIHIRRQSYKVILDPEATFYEAFPESTSGRIRQKVRRAEGHVRILLNNLDIFFNRKYNGFGLYVFPANFFMIILSPLLLCISFAIFVLDLLLFSSMQIIDILAIVSIGLLFLGRRKALVSGVWSILELQFAQLLAIRNVLLGRQQHMWEKVDREVQAIPHQQ